MASQSPTIVQKQMRNIVILGKTGCGKSTIANRIIGSEVFKVKRSLSAGTTEAVQQEAEIQVDGVHYNMKIIDTVGLFGPPEEEEEEEEDPSKKNDDDKANDEILLKTKEFFRSHVDGFNLVLFVLKEGRFTREEKEAFDKLTTNFREDVLGQVSALVITCCEHFNEDKRKSVIQELSRNRRSKKFCEFMGKGIFTVGFPDTSTAPPAVQAAYTKTAEKDEKSLRDLVMRSDKKFLCQELLTDSFWERVGRTLCNIL